MKKLFALILTLTMLAALTACGGVDNGLGGSKTDSTTSPSQGGQTASSADGGSNTGTAKPPAGIEEVKGTTLDTGELSLLCPEGWSAMPEHLAPKSTNELEIYKGAADAAKPLEFERISVTYYSSGGDSVTLSKSLFEGSKDIAAIQLGGKTFEGFTYSSGDLNIVCLLAHEGKKAYKINLRLSKSVTLDSIDVQAVIASVQGK